MGKTRDLFKKIRDTKGTFHAKMGTIKDRNIILLSRRGGKNTQKSYTKKIFMTQVTMICDHSTPDILECEVRGTLRSITTNKASGGDEIPVEYFKP